MLADRRRRGCRWIADRSRPMTSEGAERRLRWPTRSVRVSSSSRVTPPPTPTSASCGRHWTGTLVGTPTPIRSGCGAGAARVTRWRALRRCCRRLKRVGSGCPGTPDMGAVSLRAWQAGQTPARCHIAAAVIAFDVLMDSASRQMTLAAPLAGAITDRAADHVDDRFPGLASWVTAVVRWRATRP